MAAFGSAPPLIGAGYWHRFQDFWLSSLQNQSGVVLFVAGAGLVGLLIITSSKWIK